MGGFESVIIKRFLWILLVLWGLFLEPVIASDDVKDLQTQLANLEDKLHQAETIPGQKGLAQVRYYDAQIKEIKKELAQKGIDTNTSTQNVSWEQHVEHDAVRQGYAASKYTPHEERLHAKLRDIEHRLDWINQQLTDPHAKHDELTHHMKQLLEERKKIEAELHHDQEDPPVDWGEKETHHHKEQREQDTLNRNKYHIDHIQAELQNIYEQIYEAHTQTLHASSGAVLQELGNKITKLEQQEITYKQRLKKLGVVPKPPQILANPQKFKKKKSIKNEDDYLEALKKHLAVIEQRIKAIKHKVRTAESGNQLSEMGAHMAQLEQQRLLLKKSIEQNTPVAQKKEDYNKKTRALMKAFPSTVPWGRVTREMQIDFQNNPEKYEPKNLPKLSASWGQHSKDNPLAHGWGKQKGRPGDYQPQPAPRQDSAIHSDANEGAPHKSSQGLWETTGADYRAQEGAQASQTTIFQPYSPENDERTATMAKIWDNGNAQYATNTSNLPSLGSNNASTIWGG